MDLFDREQHLERTGIWKDLDAEDRRRLAEAASAVEFPAGALIFREGEIGDCAYVVVRGSVQVFTFAKNGQELELARLKESAQFGEQSLLPGRSNRRNASVRAAEDVTLLRILKADFQKALSRQRQFSEMLTQAGEVQASQNLSRQKALVRVWALFMFANGFITIAIQSGLAMFFQTPFIFPSLGATAFLLFFTPTTPPASPRNVICGHAIGIVCGYIALWLTGLQYAGPATVMALEWSRILATALSLGTSGALMILLNVSHPPACATTLIVSLGLVTKPGLLVVLECAVILLTLQAFCINRLAGIKYPRWAR